MPGLFRSLFGGGKSSQPPVRRLTHPRDLRQGDIIRFGYLDQSELSNTQFEVAEINTYIYGDMCYPELVLKDDTGTLLYLMVEEEDGETWLALAKKIPKSMIEAIVDTATFGQILARGAGTKVQVHSKPDGFAAWLADGYREVDDRVTGDFVRGDARYLSPEALSRREHFTSYILEDPSEEFALEIEAYDTGEVEMCATVYHDVDAIAEMWPGAFTIPGTGSEGAG
jgi:hypothetical protein